MMNDVFAVGKHEGKKEEETRVSSSFNLYNAFCLAKSYLHILRSKIFHICPWANISRGKAVFHPTKSDFTENGNAVFTVMHLPYGKYDVRSAYDE